MDPKIFDYLIDDSTILEKDPLEKLSKNRELMAYKHQGFWQCIDTKRDREVLQNLWETKNAPWKV
jgi:glucose-1-phosphate cytidylyltransferase